MSRGRHSHSSVLCEQSLPYRVTGDTSPSAGPGTPGFQSEGRGEGGGSGRDQLTFLDLFCGCGGFTLGMLRAGFRCLAAIDSNAEAITTLRANLVKRPHPDFSPVEHALQRDLTQFPPTELAMLIGTRSVNVIVGGPPCQGF